MKQDDLKKDPEHKDGTIAILKLTDESAEYIKDWCDSHSIDCMPVEKLHCTILYSRKPVPDLTVIDGIEVKFKAEILEWEKFGEALVLKLDSKKIDKLHEILMNQGGTHDFPEYIAHVSVSYSFKGEIPSILPKKVIHFNTLCVEPIDKNFGDKVDDK